MEIVYLPLRNPGERVYAIAVQAAKRRVGWQMAQKHLHAELNAEVESIGGRYVIDKEVVLRHAGRETLVTFGCSLVDTSCCGAGTGCRFANVAGYVLAWKTKDGENGSPVSYVEPIDDEGAREEIRRLIASIEPHCQVNFL